jgi:hypothetical protein
MSQRSHGAPLPPSAATTDSDAASDGFGEPKAPPFRIESIRLNATPKIVQDVSATRKSTSVEQPINSDRDALFHPSAPDELEKSQPRNPTPPLPPPGDGELTTKDLLHQRPPPPPIPPEFSGRARTISFDDIDNNRPSSVSSSDGGEENEDDEYDDDDDDSSDDSSSDEDEDPNLKAQSTTSFAANEPGLAQ